MRRNEARNLIPEDQIGEKAMQEKASTTEANIANIQLDVREFRTDMKAANEAIADVKVTVAVMDGKINALSTKVDALDARVGSLESKFDRFGEKFDENRKDIISLRSMVKAIIWLLTAGLGSLIALATLAKTLRWI